jgi:DNA-binding response OmpR family regulator
MEPARVRLAVPDDPRLLDRLVAALARQGEPVISVARGDTAVLTFEAPTAELMLRSRVLQAFEDIVGDDWQGLVEPVG